MQLSVTPAKMSSAEDYDQHPGQRSRVKKQSAGFLPVIIFILIAVTVGFYFYVQKSPSSTYLDYGTAVEPIQMQGLGGDQTDSSSSAHGGNTQTTGTSGRNQPAITPSDTDGDSQAPSTSLLASSLPFDSFDASSDQITTPRVSESDVSQLMIDRLNTFYTHLDSQQYMSEFVLQGTSKEHFTKLIQKLLVNPPIVTRETDNLFSLLKNTAHFFRILGKDNILLLKGILDRERASLEDMLEAFFVLTDTPQLLEYEYGLKVDSNALYDYASFLIHTMGGRLYLFRRDSTSRMAVTYYAILTIDRASIEGNSRHGIDIRPALSSLIEEIENGGKRLKSRDNMLDRLYDLQVKYN